jgi:DNA-binding GntR family transcriptional regulator
MIPSPSVDRPNLSDSVAAAVRELIVDGRLRPGERVNEVRLAARLGVSRTPLREALTWLVAEGTLASRPRCGFHVRPLTLEEFEQVYPIRALLDPEALRLAGLPPPRQLARLTALNRKLREAHDPEAVIARDDAWHLELLAGCPNRVLVGLIEQFMARTHRYELALMRERPHVLRAAHAHDAILAALRAGNLRGACAALLRNMESGQAPIVAWLRERETQSEGERS